LIKKSRVPGAASQRCILAPVRGQGYRPAASWVYQMPVLGEAQQAGDSWAAGNYGQSAIHEVTGFLELALFAEDAVVSAWDSFAGLFTKKTVISTTAEVAPKLLGTARMNLLNAVEDKELRGIIDKLYRADAKNRLRKHGGLD
jgi:hypothetical protein